jgi:hypothetical protein
MSRSQVGINIHRILRWGGWRTALGGGSDLVRLPGRGRAISLCRRRRVRVFGGRGHGDWAVLSVRWRKELYDPKSFGR